MSAVCRDGVGHKWSSRGGRAVSSRRGCAVGALAVSGASGPQTFGVRPRFGSSMPNCRDSDYRWLFELHHCSDRSAHYAIWGVRPARNPRARAVAIDLADRPSARPARGGGSRVCGRGEGGADATPAPSETSSRTPDSGATVAQPSARRAASGLVQLSLLGDASGPRPCPAGSGRSPPRSGRAAGPATGSGLVSGRTDRISPTRPRHPCRTPWSPIRGYRRARSG